MAYIVIGLSAAAGYRVAVCVTNWLTRTPLVVLVVIAVMGNFVGQNTAVLRVVGVIEVMLNDVIVGLALGAVIAKLIQDRQIRSASRGEPVAAKTDGREYSK